MRVKVLRIGGQSYDVDVSEQATCEELKSQLVEVASLPAERQRIIFRGRVLTNDLRLSEAGISEGMTLHLVDSPSGGEPRGAAPQGHQQNQAGGGDGMGGMGFMGGLFGGLGGVQGMPPGSQGATMMGHVVLDPVSAGGVPSADLGNMIAQQIAAALGGAGGATTVTSVGGMPGMMPAGMWPQQGAAGAGAGPAQASIPLRMPPLPAMSPLDGPSPHLFSGLALMMSRLEHEAHHVELDPLPHIRESYRAPPVPEVRHFLQAARTLLNTAPLVTRTRNAINDMLEAEDLPPLRPYRRPRGPPSVCSDSEDSLTTSSSSGMGITWRPGRGAAPSRQQGEGVPSGESRELHSRGQAAVGGAVGGGSRGILQCSRSSEALRSFPLPVEGSDEEEGRGAGQGCADRRGREEEGTAQPEEEMPSLVSDDDEEEHEGGHQTRTPASPPGQPERPGDSGEGEEGAEEEYVEEDSAWETEEEEGGEDDFDAENELSVSEEQLVLVAAVCLGEMASRLLYCLGDDGGRLWELSDQLRTLSRVQRRDYPRLAGMVQELTARTYRLGGMWSELSRGMQYLGAALESGNMAVVSAIPGYLSVRNSQALPNVQRPSFPPMQYVPHPAGYFAGQMPDQHGFGIPGLGIPVSSTVVDVQVATSSAAGSSTAPPGMAPGAAGGAPQQAQQGQQQGGMRQPPGVMGVPLGSARVVVPTAGAQQGGGQHGVSQHGAQHAAQQGLPRPMVPRQALAAVQGLVSSSRAGMDQAADRVQEARNAVQGAQQVWEMKQTALKLQAVVTGREGGPQIFLQRAHHTMQALVTAEESIHRARQRAEQAEQQLQRLSRSQPVVQQAVRISMGGPQPGTAGAAGQQQAQQARMPLGTMLQGVLQGVMRQHAQHAQQQPAVGSDASRRAAAGTAGGGTTASGREVGQGGPSEGTAAPGAAAGAVPEAGAGGEGAATPGADQPIPAMSMAQELLSSLGLSSEEQQEMMQQFTGVTQALQQSSLAALNLPALLADIQRALAAALREVPQQAQQQQGGSAQGASTEAADGAAPAPAGLGEAVVPRLVDAVRAVLERHLAHLAQAPALQEFLPHLQHMGINLVAPAAGGTSSGGADSQPPPAAQAQAAAGYAPGAARNVPQPAATVAGAGTAVSTGAAVGAAAQQEPGPSSSAPPAAEEGPGAISGKVVGEGPAGSDKGEDAGGSGTSGGGSGSQKAGAAKPAGLGLAKGLGRGLSKGRGLSLPGRAAGKQKTQDGGGAMDSEQGKGGGASSSHSSLGEGLLKLLKESQSSTHSTPASIQGGAPGAHADQQQQQQEQKGVEAGGGAAMAADAPSSAQDANVEEVQGLAAAGGSHGEAVAPLADPSASAGASEPPSAVGGEAAGEGSTLQITPPRPQASGSNLSSLMSGLLGGVSSRGSWRMSGAGGTLATAGSAGGGGGLLGLMGSVMQSPAFQQMASSPSMQQMAERMMGGGGAEGGAMDLGSLMGSLMGGGEGAAAGLGGRGPRARRMDGVLGGGGRGDEALPDDGPVDLDSALSVLGPEEAARWREIIERDIELQAQMEGQPSAPERGFSDAYSALRMADQRGASRSGLLGLLGDAEGSQQGDE